MTEPKPLTQEQKRTALAEARGWKWYRHVDESNSAHPGCRFIAFPGEWMVSIRCREADMTDPVHPPAEPLPDYFGSLDAIHEFEMWLKSEEEHSYCCYCENLFQKHGAAAISLSAAERAEELGQILGLWATQPSEAP